MTRTGSRGGAQPNISLAVGFKSMIIDQPGHAESQSVEVTPVQGFSGQISLSCNVVYVDSGPDKSPAHVRIQP